MAHTAGLSVQLVLMLQPTAEDARRFDYEHITGHITSYKLLLIPVKDILQAVLHFIYVLRPTAARLEK